ncbi:MAG: hypothetical protein QMD09_12855 [Desulfatibacillaceae bacterium]|nr:hypothetical protein [Desulfatibacillaceae bacterium]
MPTTTFLTPTLALLAKYSGTGPGPSGSIPPLPALTFAPRQARAAYKPPAPLPSSAMPLGERSTGFARPLPGLSGFAANDIVAFMDHKEYEKNLSALKDATQKARERLAELGKSIEPWPDDRPKKPSPVSLDLTPLEMGTDQAARHQARQKQEGWTQAVKNLEGLLAQAQDIEHYLSAQKENPDDWPKVLAGLRMAIPHEAEFVENAQRLWAERHVTPVEKRSEKLVHPRLSGQVQSPRQEAGDTRRRVLLSQTARQGFDSTLLGSRLGQSPLPGQTILGR